MFSSAKLKSSNKKKKGNSLRANNKVQSLTQAHLLAVSQLVTRATSLSVRIAHRDQNLYCVFLVNMPHTLSACNRLHINVTPKYTEIVTFEMWFCFCSMFFSSPSAFKVKMTRTRHCAMKMLLLQSTVWSMHEAVFSIHGFSWYFSAQQNAYEHVL